MHERERHRIILETLQARPVATVGDFALATGGSEATVRRDLAALARQGRLRKLRGGAEALHPPVVVPLDSHRGTGAGVANLAAKRAIGRKAVSLCEAGDAIIINGGTTTFQMVHALSSLPLQVLTNSFGIADHLLRQSRCTVFVPFGTIYREQNIILSPLPDDGTRHFRARRMFMGCRGLSSLGIMEEDALIMSSEQRLMGQADELVLLVDSSKFAAQSSMILAPLGRASTVITDSRISATDRAMIADAGITLIIADAVRDSDQSSSPSTA
ncbi:DeoR/GlpR family DNA-binding transcription regulator [Lichenihabitans sp. Uapishka_5]|uniref:DeoR/GlpR family DNA-binding transcription regulator n=1 Tax=Lichenihabitans sp. Uapishka_5 TaxID=3037302 RepID=UPI0029E81F1F|nr:DeoR/GlpR family DNA-binding transcription regulator [Lichenihabitans sp. Uapishka_5]MDX7953031.1 DeoR/GlpR family DNA-binding transcription regulator [Lichenihabitans sp. Uapishka_5]